MEKIENVARIFSPYFENKLKNEKRELTTDVPTQGVSYSPKFCGKHSFLNLVRIWPICVSQIILNRVPVDSEVNI